MPAAITRRQEYFIDNGDPVALDTYRQRRAQKRLPIVTISRDRKAFLVTLDMTQTGAALNSLGQRAFSLLAARLGNPTLTATTPIRAYSLATAEKAAKELATMAKQVQYRQTVLSAA